MASVQVWSFSASGKAQGVTEDIGRFHQDQAYVVLADGSSDTAVYLWAGEAAPQDNKVAAAKHAGELTKSLDAKFLRQEQGSETAAFKALFDEFAIVPAAEAAADSAEVSEDKEAAAEAEADAAAEEKGGSPKKGKGKKKKKGKGGAGGAVAAAAPEPAVAAKENSVVDGREEGQEEQAGGKAAAEQPSKEEERKKDETKEEDRKEEGTKEEESKQDVEADVAQESRTISKAAEKPAAGRDAVSKEAVAATPKAAAAANGAAKAADSPKVAAVEEDSTAAAREELKKRMSSSTGEVQKEGSPAPTKTFTTEAAKAWSGSPVAGSVAAPEVQVKPGDKTYSYEELKELRADSGIDMARKEDYLADGDFEKVFGKARAEWKAQPAWRQQQSKKQVGLW